MALTHRQSSVSESPSRPSTPDFGRAIGFVAGGIGDQIYHLGQLRALAAACQTATIDIACIHPGPISRILAATPWVGRVVDARPLRRYKPWSRTSETVTALRHRRYDTAFFMHRSTSFKLAARTAGIPRRIGLADGFFDRMLLDTPLALTDGGARREAWGHRPFIAAMDEYVIGSGPRPDDIFIHCGDEWAMPPCLAPGAAICEGERRVQQHPVEKPVCKSDPARDAGSAGGQLEAG